MNLVFLLAAEEISNITGISVRTLHYYDEIGLLKPTDKSDTEWGFFRTIGNCCNRSGCQQELLCNLKKPKK